VNATLALASCGSSLSFRLDRPDGLATNLGGPEDPHGPHLTREGGVVVAAATIPLPHREPVSRLGVRGEKHILGAFLAIGPGALGFTDQTSGLATGLPPDPRGLEEVGQSIDRPDTGYGDRRGPN